MTTPRRLVSIVCPAYQEEEVLPRFHAKLSAALTALDGAYDFEILYVDDGSRDGTLDVLRTIAACDDRVRYLSLSRNFGHQAALTAGLEHAAGEAVVSLDSDLQHPPELIAELLARWGDGYDVVATMRQEDPRLGLLKRWTSRMFYRVMHRLSDVEIRSAASDFRLLSRKAVDALLQLGESHRFLRGMVGWIGFRTAVVTFQPAQRAAGASKYDFRRMCGLAFNGLLSFSKSPLRLALSTGLGLIAFSVVYACYVAGAAIVGYVGEGWAFRALFFSLYFLSGLVLCGLGIVGEYVGRIYEQVKDRPLYLVKESRLTADALAPAAPTRRAA